MDYQNKSTQNTFFEMPNDSDKKMDSTELFIEWAKGKLRRGENMSPENVRIFLDKTRPVSVNDIDLSYIDKILPIEELEKREWENDVRRKFLLTAESPEQLGNMADILGITLYEAEELLSQN